VKGTKYFDGKSSRYVDYPLTDVLQMIGRAGRPGLDTKAFAVVMATEDKKNYYKKFLVSGCSSCGAATDTSADSRLTYTKSLFP
jgi:replicative superfamily II helicase